MKLIYDDSSEDSGCFWGWQRMEERRQSFWVVSNIFFVDMSVGDIVVLVCKNLINWILYVFISELFVY